MNPMISIIVPIYNDNNYLKQCLDSLINQTLKKIEIICVNDGSTDNSLEIIMDYINDNRIIIINKTNSGYGDSLNHGINFVSGKYIGFVDSDDFVEIDMFESLYKLAKNGNIDMVRSDYYLYFNERQKKVVKFNIIKDLYNKSFNPIENPNIFLININMWAEIYKKDLILNNNIKFLPTPGASYQDTSFFFKTLFKAKKIFYINKPFYYYRQTNLNSSINNNTLNKIQYIFEEFNESEKYLKKSLKIFIEIQKYYNTKKMRSLLWNLIKVDKKKEYIKLLYNEIIEILITENYLKNLFNKYENIFLSNLVNYGVEFSTDIYINTLSYNILNPKISIIMPIFNSEKYIEECLSSLLKQTFKNFEIICINDGSIDNTLEILKEFEKIDKRIHVFTQENTGPGIARNNGINKTKGEYLIFLDSDDIFEDTMLEELYSKIKGNDNDIVICNSNNFIFLNGKKKIIRKKNYLISDEIIIKNKSFSSLDIKSDFFNKFIWWPWDKIFKKKFLENLGIKYQNLNNSEDLFFIASAVIMAKKISYLDKIFINHRMGENTSISNSRQKYWDNFYYALKELKNFLKKKGLYKRFKQDFINYVASFSLWNLETIFGNSFCNLYQKLKYEWLKEFGVNKYNKNYFYNIIIYKKVKNIMKTDLKFIKNINETTIENQNKRKIDYFKEINKKCSNKLKMKSKIIYFIFSNIK